MRVANSLLVEGLVATVASGDLETVASVFADDVTYFVHTPAYGPEVLGDCRGRDMLVRRLEMLSKQIEVKEFRLLRMQTVNGRHACQIKFAYRHLRTGLGIDGLMRLFVQIENERVVSVEIIYDSDGMAAFFALTKGTAA
ncbi:MAG: nuclear transport factor 2 family protein [Hyphomicrobiaceae bacterium]